MVSLSLVSRTSLLTVTCLGIPTLLACLDHPLKPVQYESSQEQQRGIALAINKDVDIIFMIDDSGSMAEEQIALATNFEDFISVLERPGVEANYRIGITTSDNGNDLCGSKPPEGGNFVMSSCRSRQQNFTFASNPPVQAFDQACADICAHDSIEITPTITDNDPEPAPRPWLENIDGRTNLPEGMSTTEAFQCLGPMGIAGCGYEEQLESLYKAVLRTQDAGERQYDFIRPNALLAIVLVTDEADGSINRAAGGQQIYDLNGSKVFWQDPDAAFPTSTVSWKGGVQCFPEDLTTGTYDDCVAQNFDLNRNVLPPERAASEAVFHPVDRYIRQIEQLEAQKQALDPNQEVIVAGLLGVPIGFQSGDIELIYRMNPTDAQFINDFGVSPGCESNLDIPELPSFQPRAVPPVRQKDFIEHFERGQGGAIFSICDADYSIALEAIAQKIEDRLRPTCMEACVQDVDTTTPDLEVDCTLIQSVPSSSGPVESDIPECSADGSLPDGEDVCYVALTDDDLSDDCRDLGWNLEFTIVRAAGQSPPGGTSVSATCQLSPTPRITCPDLGN